MRLDTVGVGVVISTKDPQDAASLNAEPSRQFRDKVEVWTYRMGRLRAASDSLILKDGETLAPIELSKNIPVYAVLEYPTDPSGKMQRKQCKLYEEATAEWDELDIRQLKPETLGEHVWRVERRLQTA